METISKELTLKELCSKYHKDGWPDKDTVHSYIPVYEELLAPYRHTAKRILEIGLMSGESLRMWTEYFDGKVAGIDCDIKPINGQADLTQIMDEGFNVVIGNASDPEVMKEYFHNSRLDVVIEDANHDISQQISIYQTVRPYMRKGGIYIIEDVQDIDRTKTLFSIMGGEVIDRRHVKNRYDDVLIIFRN